ncbi:MAG TPA: CsgG/HfaB family protein [Syntrophales bacterium]|nr:CsgG/HfaB family protein [Syntrophales bacterium]
MKLKAAFVLITLSVMASAGFAAPPRSSVAVLDFEGIGVDIHIGKAVSEIIRTALVGIPRFQVVERAQINQALSEQQFQKSGVIDDKSAVKIGKIVGADLIIIGSVVKIGNAYTINSRMIDVQTGEAKLGKNVTGTDLNQLTGMSNDLVKSLFGDRPESPATASPAKPGPVAARKAYQRLENWEILNGEWSNAPDGSIIGSNGHIILKEEFRDYVLEVTAEHLSGPKSGVGIGARCSVVPGGQKTFRNRTSINQGYSFNFSFNKSYNVYSGLAGNWYPMNPDWQRYEWLRTDILDESVNRIRIEAVEKQITIYVNNRFLVRFSDSGHVQGAPLLWVQENSGEKVRFFDLRIEGR